jgi:hypothetical protein
VAEGAAVAVDGDAAGVGGAGVEGVGAGEEDGKAVGGAAASA